MIETKTKFLASPSDWKNAMQQQLRESGMSRYVFIRKCHAEGLCSIHTGECLLADNGTVTGQRSPSLGLAISMAKLAGLDLVFVERG